MNVLSLFDGISCGRLAFDMIARNVNYYASEINSSTIKVSKHNYPDIIQLGDVTNWKSWELPQIDLVIGGSPCQGFSVGGRGLNFEDPRSKLFFDMVDIIEGLNPTYFMLENVNMKEEWRNIISKYLGVQPVKINSNIMVPQNRVRLYWCNFDIPALPESTNMTIQDILQDDVDEHYYLTERQLSKLDLNYRWTDNKIKKHKAGKHQQDTIYRYDGIMGCLSAATHGAARHLTKTYLPNGKLRRLTEIECERLQGVPDDYTSCISSSPRYEALGNGWTVPIISHIFKGI